MQLTKELRELGYCAEYDLMGRGIKPQMKYANKINAAFTVVIGDNELESGKVKLKEMTKGEETEVALDDKFVGAFDSIFIDKMFEEIDEASTVKMFGQMGGHQQ